MPINEKYNQLGRVNKRLYRALHVRLGREVDIYELPLDERHASVVRAVASKIGTLDHPAIPHLIDAIWEQSTLHLVTESQEVTLARSDTCLLDRLTPLEQIADAVRHAKARGVAHGELNETSIQHDSMGNPRLVGLGIQQCLGIELDFERLCDDDMRQLKVLIAKVLPDAPEDDEEARLSSELRNIVTANYGDVADFHRAVRGWLHREMSLREAKQLVVRDATPPPLRGKIMIPMAMLTACAAVVLLLSGLVALAVWLSDVQVAERSTDVRPRSDETKSVLPSTKGATSELASVGPLNNSEGMQDGSKEASHATETPSIAAVRINSVPDLSELEIPQVEIDSAAQVRIDSAIEQLSNTALASADHRTTRTSSPFEHAPSSIDLPDLADKSRVRLVATDLLDEESIRIDLLGGDTAFRQGAFRLRSVKASRAWRIEYQHSDVQEEIAELDLTASELGFRWLELSAASIAARYLQNTLFALQSDAWSHDVALRTPELGPDLIVDLERSRAYEFAIESMPRLDEVVIEFLPEIGSPAEASPNSTMSADGGRMRIGLDAGRKSLVVLELEAKSGGKLRTLGWARLTTSSPPQKMMPGFERKLRSSNQLLNKNIFSLKSQVDLLKGREVAERKKAMQAVIEQLGAARESAAIFWEAYLAAKASPLTFQVYRKIGAKKLVLVEFRWSVR